MACRAAKKIMSLCWRFYGVNGTAGDGISHPKKLAESMGWLALAGTDA